jgi:putative phosphoesterase
VGRPEVLERLRAAVPEVIAVRGNVDLAWARDLPDRVCLDVRGRRCLLLHDVHALAAGGCGYDVVVSGHSHRPGVERRDGTLFVNPGSAGPRRFRLPVAVARLGFSTPEVAAQIVELAV